MKLLVLSDLHIEFAQFRVPLRSQLGYDVVVLAGDIFPGHRVVSLLRRPQMFGPDVPIVLVPGNHEYYGSNRQSTLKALREAGSNTNVHVLDRDEVTVGGVRFLGATLWTDYAVGAKADPAAIAGSMAYCRLAMNDHNRITESDPLARGKSRKLRPEDCLHEHELSRAWLLDRLHGSNAKASQTVVVTHHGPSSRSIADWYRGDPLNAAFVSELPPEFFGRSALWIHGHTHSSLDYMHHGTRVVVNPRGYRLFGGANENSDFNPEMIIEI